MDREVVSATVRAKYRTAAFPDECAQRNLWLIENVRFAAPVRASSLKELAERCAMTERTIHNIVGGKTSPAFVNLIALSQVLQVWPGQLLLPHDMFRALPTVRVRW